MKARSLGAGVVMLIAGSTLSLGCHHEDLEQRSKAAATRAEDAARRAEAAAGRVEVAAKRTEAAADRAEQLLSHAMESESRHHHRR